MLSIIVKILEGILANPYAFDHTGQKVCKFCTGMPAGYRDYPTFTHENDCPTVLLEQLQASQRGLQFLQERYSQIEEEA